MNFEDYDYEKIIEIELSKKEYNNLESCKKLNKLKKSGINFNQFCKSLDGMINQNELKPVVNFKKPEEILIQVGIRENKEFMTKMINKNIE